MEQISGGWGNFDFLFSSAVDFPPLGESAGFRPHGVLKDGRSVASMPNWHGFSPMQGAPAAGPGTDLEEMQSGHVCVVSCFRDVPRLEIRQRLREKTFEEILKDGRPLPVAGATGSGAASGFVGTAPNDRAAEATVVVDENVSAAAGSRLAPLIAAAPAPGEVEDEGVSMEVVGAATG